MTAFGKLIRTTAFRLTLAYLLLFALFAASLLAYFAWNTRRLITEQITTTVNAEIGEVSDSLSGGGACSDLLLHFSENTGAVGQRRMCVEIITPTAGGDDRRC